MSDQKESRDIRIGADNPAGSHASRELGGDAALSDLPGHFNAGGGQVALSDIRLVVEVLLGRHVDEAGARSAALRIRDVIGSVRHHEVNALDLSDAQAGSITHVADGYPHTINATDRYGGVGGSGVVRYVDGDALAADISAHDATKQTRR